MPRRQPGTEPPRRTERAGQPTPPSTSTGSRPHRQERGRLPESSPGVSAGDHLAERRLLLVRQVGLNELGLELAPSSNAAFTLSVTASLDIRNSADVPGVILSRADLMKLVVDPDVGQRSRDRTGRGPMAAPSSGTRKISPKSMPQNMPPIAPAPVRLFSCLVLGFFASGCHDTVAASWMLISFCLASDLQGGDGLVRPGRGVELPNGQCRHRAAPHRLPGGQWQPAPTAERFPHPGWVRVSRAGPRSEARISRRLGRWLLLRGQSRVSLR